MKITVPVVCVLMFNIFVPAWGQVIIDGTVGESEWLGADAATASISSDWGPVNRLDMVRVLNDGTFLNLAVEGEVASGNAILLYLDYTTGGISDMSTLADVVGQVDIAIGNDGIVAPGFGAELAWATLDMSRAVGGLDDRMGWRDITYFWEFWWIDAPTACGPSACETRIPLAALNSSGRISLFVRLGSADSSYLSNQTLPEDAPGSPGDVSVFLTVVVGESIFSDGFETGDSAEWSSAVGEVP